MVFDREGRNFCRIVLPEREVRFQLRHNGLYYFDTADRENSVLLPKTVSENREGCTRRKYEGDWEERQSMHLLGSLLERDFDNMVCSNMIVKFSVTFGNF